MVRTNMEALKVEIKTWERDFEKNNGRLPEKEDIKKDKEIKRKYKQYAQLKKASTRLCSDAIDVQKTPIKMELGNLKAEFGPTPQMNGKLVSIFEMRFSAMKTAQEPDLVPSPLKGSQSVVRRLDFAITPNSSPIKQQSTELLFAEPISRPKYGPNSPMHLADIGLQLSETPSRILKSFDANSSPFSPSPLIKRPAKSLSQLAKEHEIIKTEFESKTEDFSEFAAIRTLAEKLQQQENLDKIEETDETNTESKRAEFVQTRKAKTIKKRTRAKMRPAALQSKPINIPQKNVHEQLAKLKQRELDKMLGREVEESESDSEQTTPAPVQKKQRKGKYNLVSNNFKRLNLPTKAGRNRASKWRSRR